MQLSHTFPVASARFDDPNLVSSAGLVPVLDLATRAGLPRLVGESSTLTGMASASAAEWTGLFDTATGPPATAPN